MGGFSPIADPSNDDIVTSIVQLAMTRLNNIADNYQLDTSANDGLTAFQQVATILIVACLWKHKLTYRKRKCYVSLILWLIGLPLETNFIYFDQQAIFRHMDKYVV